MARQRILGIDPGLRLTGYGLVDLATGAIEPTLVEGGVIRLDAKKPMAQRLYQLDEEMKALLARAQPTHAAVEKLYAHYKHPRTAILMGHARGVILLAATRAKVPVSDVPSTEVKKALTGYGHASKEQMQRAIAAQFGLPEPPRPPDVADALAIALTFARRLAIDEL